jgi:hypothetical protein
MKQCFALVLLAFGLGVFATNSHGQAYQPCFDDPVFEEASYATVEFEQPQIETSKVIAAQIEKAKFEVAVVDKPTLLKPEMIKAQIISPEFEKTCQKSTIRPSAVPDKIVWVSSYQPSKIQLMQPLSKNTHLMASHTSR